jgi:hypothetical protein
MHARAHGPPWQVPLQTDLTPTTPSMAFLFFHQVQFLCDELGPGVIIERQPLLRVKAVIMGNRFVGGLQTET